jgi:hypothetical protein
VDVWGKGVPRHREVDIFAELDAEFGGGEQPEPLVGATAVTATTDGATPVIDPVSEMDM